MLILAAILGTVAYILSRDMKRDIRGVENRNFVAGTRVAIKDGVQTQGVKSVMGQAIDTARSVGLSPVVTSGYRPGDRGSLHAQGLALDFRSRHLSTNESVRVAEEMQEKLGSDWDVIAEFNPAHIHVEYDP